MSNGDSSSRTGAIILTATLAFAAGYGTAKLMGPATVTNVCKTKGSHNIQVDAASGSLDCPEVPIGGQNTVTWFASDGKATLDIKFKTAGVFTPNCDGTTSVCGSGLPRIVWGTNETQRNCDYTGTVTSAAGAKFPITGRIIIIKP